MIEQVVIALLWIAVVLQTYLLYREQKTTGYWRARWERSDEHLQAALRKAEELADRLTDCREVRDDMQAERDRLIASWPSDVGSGHWQSFPIGTVFEDDDGQYWIAKEDGMDGPYDTHREAAREAAGLDREEDRWKP